MELRFDMCFFSTTGLCRVLHSVRKVSTPSDSYETVGDAMNTRLNRIAAAKYGTAWHAQRLYSIIL